MLALTAVQCETGHAFKHLVLTVFIVMKRLLIVIVVVAIKIVFFSQCGHKHQAQATVTKGRRAEN